MRNRLFLALSLLISVAGMSCADGGGAELRINTMIDDGLYRNLGAIRAASDELTAEQRYRLFLENESDPTVPFIVSLVAGFGVGSFVQRDLSGGLMGVGLDVGGCALLTIGYLVLLSEWMVDFPYGDPYPDFSERHVVYLSMIVAGGGMLSVSRLYQMIRPFTYARRYNDDLRRALQM